MDGRITIHLRHRQAPITSVGPRANYAAIAESLELADAGWVSVLDASGGGTDLLVRKSDVTILEWRQL